MAESLASASHPRGSMIVFPLLQTQCTGRQGQQGLSSGLIQYCVLCHYMRLLCTGTHLLEWASEQRWLVRHGSVGCLNGYYNFRRNGIGVLPHTSSWLRYRQVPLPRWDSNPVLFNLTLLFPGFEPRTWGVVARRLVH